MVCLGRNKRHESLADDTEELGQVIQGPFIITDDAADADGPVITSDGQMMSLMYRAAGSVFIECFISLSYCVLYCCLA